METGGRGRERVSRGSHPREGTGNVNFRGGGVDGDGDGDSGDFTRVLQVRAQQRHVHATTVGTILRPIGRPCANIMAPLSCGASTPTSFVGVGAAPLPRSERVYTRPLPSAVLIVSSSYPFIFRPLRPPSSVRRDDYPLTLSWRPRGHLIPLPLPPNRPLLPFLFLVVVLLFLPSWSPRDPSLGAPQRFLQRAQRRASGAHRWLLPFTAQRARARRGRLVSRERALPFSLASLFSPSSHPVSPFCARRGGNRLQLKLRSRAHRSKINACPLNPSSLPAGGLHFCRMNGF